VGEAVFGKRRSLFPPSTSASAPKTSQHHHCWTTLTPNKFQYDVPELNGRVQAHTLASGCVVCPWWQPRRRVLSTAPPTRPEFLNIWCVNDLYVDICKPVLTERSSEKFESERAAARRVRDIPSGQYLHVFIFYVYANRSHLAAAMRSASALSGIVAASTLEGKLSLYSNYTTSIIL